MMFPAADPNDGLIDLAIFTSMGRAEALKVSSDNGRCTGAELTGVHRPWTEPSRARCFRTVR